MPTKLSTYLYPGSVTQTLAEIAAAAGLPPNFNWTPYAMPGLAAHVNQYGKAWSDPRYTNQASVVLMIVQSAIGAYPQLNQILSQISPGSAFWDSGEAFRQSSAERSKAAGRAETIGLLSVVLAPVAVWFLAPAAGAGAAVTAESGVAVVQGAELAALVEAGTVGAEGAFLEAAALSGSAVTYSTATGAMLSAVTPAGETVLFDAAIDPFTQFGQMPIDNVQLPQDSAQIPQQTQQPPQSSEFSKPVTEYAKKLLASEALKLLTGGKQSPGATAVAQKNAAAQQLAPGQEMGDITPLVALAMIAGAFLLR